MVNVDIDKELYDSIKSLIKEKKYDYPSVKFFVQKCLHNEVSRLKGDPDDVFGKVKLLLKNNPKLKEKIEEVYSSEIKGGALND